MATLIVKLSTATINLWNRRHVEADELARHAAEWRVFSGRTKGIVDLSREDNDLSDFCQYYIQDEVHQTMGHEVVAGQYE